MTPPLTWPKLSPTIMRGCVGLKETWLSLPCFLGIICWTQTACNTSISYISLGGQLMPGSQYNWNPLIGWEFHHDNFITIACHWASSVLIIDIQTIQLRRTGDWGAQRHLMCVEMEIVNMNLPVLGDSREHGAGVRRPGDVADPAVQVKCHQGLSADILASLVSKYHIGIVTKHRLQHIKIVTRVLVSVVLCLVQC